jgi:hypothetical protein
LNRTAWKILDFLIFVEPFSTFSITKQTPSKTNQKKAKEKTDLFSNQSNMKETFPPLQLQEVGLEAIFGNFLKWNPKRRSNRICCSNSLKTTSPIIISNKNRMTIRQLKRDSLLFNSVLYSFFYFLSFSFLYFFYTYGIKYIVFKF